MTDRMTRGKNLPSTGRMLALGLFGALMAAPAIAAETTTYTYDALGRLTGSSVSGGPSSGVATALQYDPAGNRGNYQVTGSANNSPPVAAVIVVPLNGFTVIPIL